MRAHDGPTFRAALARAREERRPCLIVVETDPHRRLPASQAWREVPPAEVSSDPAVKELRARFETERELQRFLG